MTHRAGRLLTRIDRAADGLAADFLLYALSAAFALFTALSSTLLPHRAWGAIAVWAYSAAALLVIGQLTARAYARSSVREALTWTTWAAACLAPLVVEAAQRAGGRTDRAQDEVLVVEQMGAQLLHSGTPYLGRDAILALPPADRLGAYRPYQPGMAVFGLPRAFFGDFWWTDARVWFAVVTASALIGAVLILRPSGLRVRAIQVVTVFPICALTLATGGDDLPVLALCLLALALAGGGRFGWAGVAVGAAAAAKLFAFPLVAVLVALAVATARAASRANGQPGLRLNRRSASITDALPEAAADRGMSPVSGTSRKTGIAADVARRSGLGDDQTGLDRGNAGIVGNNPATGGDKPGGNGNRPPLGGDQSDVDEDQPGGGDRSGRRGDRFGAARARRLLPGAIGLPLLVLIPPLLVDPDGLIENVLRFPLGHGVVASPAQSPFPGFLIAQYLPGGRFLASALLVAVAAAIGIRLLRKPPRSATAAALISGYGLLAAILLMPTTRFGYLLYPAALLVWAPVLAVPARTPGPSGA